MLSHPLKSSCMRFAAFSSGEISVISLHPLKLSIVKLFKFPVAEYLLDYHNMISQEF